MAHLKKTRNSCLGNKNVTLILVTISCVMARHDFWLLKAHSYVQSLLTISKPGADVINNLLTAANTMTIVYQSESFTSA